MKSPSRRHSAAFSLIELMATITIMIILAGIIVGGLGFVNEKQAREKAKVQIAMLSKALEEYKLDYGTYPSTKNTQTGIESGGGTIRVTGVNPANNRYTNNTSLFNLLYQYGVSRKSRIYLPELQLLPGQSTNAQGWITSTTGTNILDPWDVSYRYRSASELQIKSGQVVGESPNADTENPDFDLWTSGKDGKTKPESPSDPTNKDDIRNF